MTMNIAKKTEISDWENEGGAEPQSARGIHRG
jgi:hypothetical protein